MALRVDYDTEQDLRWYYSGDYRGDMGERSTQGGIVFAIQSCRAQMPGKAGDVSERQRYAAQRLDRISKRIKQCSIAHRALLAAAFGPTTFAGYDISKSGLAAFGQYPNAVLACPEAVKAKGASPASLPEWLVMKAATADGRTHSGKGEVSEADRVEADRVVKALREAAEARLAEALREYGAPVEEVQAPGEVSLRDIGRAMGVHHETAGAEAKRRGVVFSRRGDARNAKVRVSLDSLWLRWPEAAESVGRNARRSA